MSKSGSPMPSSNDRTYRFISDPSHKENLSGRVRAACLTCRRKKIKCSGELSCRTCREKGLVCEGLPERKKPRRASVASSILEPCVSGIERKKKNKPASLKLKPESREHIESPKASPATAVSVDSGYLSGRNAASDAEMSPAAVSQLSSDDVLSVDGLDLSQPLYTTDNDSLQGHSPATHGNEAWNLDADLGASQTSEVSNPEPMDIPSEELDPSLQSLFSPVEWAKAQCTLPPWAKNIGEEVSASSFISVAKALEERARELRQLAEQQQQPQSPQSPDNQFRRQTIALPINSPGLFGACGEMAAMDGQLATFEDLPLFMPVRTPGRTSCAGAMPDAHDCSSWWDISPDMTALLGRGLKQASDSQANAAPAADAATSTLFPDTDGEFAHFRQPAAESLLTSFHSPSTLERDYCGQGLTWVE